MYVFKIIQFSETPQGKGCLFIKSGGFAAHKFCPRFKSGHKFVFVCRVLTGTPMRGYKDLKVKDTDKTVTSAVDSLDNPRLYLTFCAEQAYPEYLMVFK